MVDSHLENCYFIIFYHILVKYHHHPVYADADGGTAAAITTQFRHGEPALFGSHTLVTPY